MILDESLFNEAMYTNISSDPYDLNVIKHKIDGDNTRDWTYIKSFKFKDDAIERANRMIANGDAYVAQVYSWKNEDHGEIYFRKADDGKIIDKSVQHVDCDVHGPEIKTVSDKTIIKPVHEAKDAESKTCVICKKPYIGYGNNAQPVAEGQCCDKCNNAKVIPARIAQLYGLKNKNINEDLNKKYTIEEYLNLKEDALASLENNRDPSDRGDIAELKNEIINIKSLKDGSLLVIDSDKAFICKDEDSIGKQISMNDAQEFLNFVELEEVSCNDTLRTCTYKAKKAEEPITEGIEPDGKDALGCDLYKYGKYSIVHFPVDFEWDGTSHHVESYIIQSPFVLDNSNYRLPLRAENEAGEEITFKTLEEAKAWIDKYDGKFKLEVKYGDEIHAVIKDEFKEIQESLNEDVAIVSLTNEQANENNGLSTILNMLIKDEFDAIQGYNDAIVNFETEGRSDLVQVLKDIVNEENLHVGQLEVLLEQVNGAANSIDQGKAEAETQLATEGGDIVEEDPEEGMHY